MPKKNNFNNAKPQNSIIKFSQSLLGPQPCYKDGELGLTIGVSIGENLEKYQPLTPASCVFISLISKVAKIHNDVAEDEVDRVQTFVSGESFIIPSGYKSREYDFHQLVFLYVNYTPKSIKTIPAGNECQQLITLCEDTAKPWQETSDGFQKKVQYQSANQKFTAGVWRGKNFTTGLIKFPYNEFMLVKQGCLVCTDEQGEVHHISDGEALFVPQAVCCAWQVNGSISLHFVQVKA